MAKPEPLDYDLTPKYALNPNVNQLQQQIEK